MVVEQLNDVLWRSNLVSMANHI